MLKNYIKIAWRNLLRNKVYSLINIAGLSIGIAVCTLIFIYIEDELSYDKHWESGERIIRVNQIFTDAGVVDPYSCTSKELTAYLKDEFPEIEHIIRIDPHNHQTVSYDDKHFNEDKQYWVDKDFFEVFDFELLYGNRNSCLKEPYSVVISEAMARRYFGSSDPMGKMLQYPHKLYKVTGVLKKTDLRSHLQPEALLSREQKGKNAAVKDWFGLSVFTYVKLKDERDVKNFDAKLKGWSRKVLDPAVKANKFSFTTDLVSQKLSDIYFDQYYQFNQFAQADKKYISIFGWVAFFVLIIACFNYMNLSTARASKRAKEVGLRKVVGADRRQLIVQFLGESIVITIIAMVLSILLLVLAIPSFNSLTGKEFAPGLVIHKPAFWMILVCILLFVAIIAGSYPAFFLSNFKPIEVLKSKLIEMKKGVFTGLKTRQALVVLQFTISMVIIVATIIVYRQFTYMKNKDLGFNKDQVVVMKFPSYMDTTEFNKIEPFKHELLRNPQILKFATTEMFVGAGRMDFFIRDDGREYSSTLDVNWGDYDYIDLLGIKIIKGRNFSREVSDDKYNFLINEAALKFLNWKDPFDKQISFDNQHFGKVIGIIKDYNYKSPHSKIEPLLIAFENGRNATGSIVLLKIQPANISENLAYIDSKWKEYFPNHPISRFFLDEKFDEQYKKDQTMLALFSWFSGFTILISCLGLLGLVSFATEQRIKEIGIRKVLGATISHLTFIISRDFLMLVCIAIVVASPIAYYFMNDWLQDFAYRTRIEAWVFILSAAIMLLVAFLALLGQALKAAQTNPVKNLRIE
jgi:putative ABC transport system permease protein